MPPETAPSNTNSFLCLHRTSSELVDWLWLTLLFDQLPSGANLITGFPYLFLLFSDHSSIYRQP